MEELDVQVLNGTTDARHPFFSPDGRWLGFWQDGLLRKVPVAGGPVVTITETSIIWGAIWTEHNGIVYADGIGLSRVAPDAGSSPVRVVVPPRGKALREPFLLPGGTTALVAIGPASITAPWGFERVDVEIALVSLATGELNPVGVRGHDPKFVAPASLLYAGPGGWIHRIGFDVRRNTVSGAGEPVLQTIGGRLAVATTGTVAYLQQFVIDDSSHLEWVSRDGRGERVYAGWSGGFGAVRMSPDGEYMAGDFSGLDGPGTQQIWVRRFPDGPVEWIVRGEPSGALFRPYWRENGAEVWFHSQFKLQSARVGTLAEPEVVFQDPRGVVESLWSADGRWLIYRTDNQAPGRGDIMALEWGVQRQPVALVATPAEETSVVLSPDERWLAYVSDDSGQREVYAQRFDPGSSHRVQISRDGGTDPRWSRSGRELFYIDARGDLIAIDVATDSDLSLGARKRLFSALPYKVGGLYTLYDVNLDDTRFLMTRDRRVEVADLVLFQHFGEALKATPDRGQLTRARRAT
jgi:serine/threonine-protein kinase